MKRRLVAEREQFEALALEDSLTGLANSRAFRDRLSTELGRAAREYYPVAAVVLDLDRFKQINDTWGHPVGDEALVKLAASIQAELRAGDFCGRLGGDEFAIALVRADGHSAERVLSRLRDRLDAIAIGPASERLNFSAGVAEFPRHARTQEELVERADSALYWGKAEGRGRTMVYRPGRGDALTPEKSEEAVRQRALMSTLTQLAKAIDSKSRWTAGHSERVAMYAVALGRSYDWPEERIDALRQAALLHDVGKIGIRDAILTKDQPLNLQELEELQHHSELGRAMLAGAGLPELARWVFHLHERADGDGYPDGLAGNEIPLESRILHAADALDHMTRPNARRRERPLEEALAELSYCAGTRIDNDVARRVVELVESGELRVQGQTARSRRSQAALSSRPR
jgi:diguanylate cyclase (GGDEF)-like protein